MRAISLKTLRYRVSDLVVADAPRPWLKFQASELVRSALIPQLILRRWADERAPRLCGNVNSAGGSRTRRHGGVFAQGKWLVIIGNSKPTLGTREYVELNAEDARITAKDRSTDRKLSKTLGRSVQAIRQRRYLLSLHQKVAVPMEQFFVRLPF
jgi:hypothetical protein